MRLEIHKKGHVYRVAQHLNLITLIRLSNRLEGNVSKIFNPSEGNAHHNDHQIKDEHQEGDKGKNQHT